MKKEVNIFLRWTLIFVFLMGVCSHFAYAQKQKKQQVETYLSEDKLPQEVLKTYKKRFATAQDPKWEYLSNEAQYQMNCILRDVPSTVCFDTMGNWISTSEELPPSRLMSSHSKNIGEFFPNFKLVSLQRLTRADKNDAFIVDIYEQQNVKKKLITRVQLDKTGKLINAQTLEEGESGKSSKQAEKERKEEEKLSKAFEKSRSLEIYPSKISESELPVSIQRWVSKNYPDYIYKQIDYEEFEEFEDEGSVYQIIIQRNGVNQPHATAWFTRDGGFLKADDPFKTVEEAVEEEETENTNTSASVAQTFRESLDWTDSVKAVFDTLLKSRYPRAKDADWDYDDDKNYVATFTDAKGENKVTYSQSGQWRGGEIKLVKIENIPASIRRYIEENYPKSTINQGWMIHEPEQKPYYTVEFYSKKTKMTEMMDFLATGKPKE